MGKSTKVYVGLVVETKRNGTLEVTEVLPKGRSEVLFCSGYTTCARNDHVLAGNVKNLTYPSVEGVGYIGEGCFKVSVQEGGKSKVSGSYYLWAAMLGRCYNTRKKCYPRYGGVGAYVVDEWHNYQNFAAWYYSQDVRDVGISWNIDKDLEYTCNKIYCPSKCNIIPSDVNSIFTGSSKITGARYSPQNNGRSWKAVISIQKEDVYLGKYYTEQEAIEVYTTAKIAHCSKVANTYREFLPEVIYNNLTSRDYVLAVLADKRNK